MEPREGDKQKVWELWLNECRILQQNKIVGLNFTFHHLKSTLYNVATGSNVKLTLKLQTDIWQLKKSPEGFSVFVVFLYIYIYNFCIFLLQLADRMRSIIWVFCEWRAIWANAGDFLARPRSCTNRPWGPGASVWDSTDGSHIAAERRRWIFNGSTVKRHKWQTGCIHPVEEDTPPSPNPILYLKK